MEEYSCSFTLNHPMTQEDWDKLIDVDMDNIPSVKFRTQHGKEVEYIKAHKPVKPQIERSGSGVTWWYVCGYCSTAINPNAKYCQQCGRPVEWDDR